MVKEKKAPDSDKFRDITNQQNNTTSTENEQLLDYFFQKAVEKVHRLNLLSEEEPIKEPSPEETPELISPMETPCSKLNFAKHETNIFNHIYFYLYGEEVA